MPCTWLCSGTQGWAQLNALPLAQAVGEAGRLPGGIVAAPQSSRRPPRTAGVLYVCSHSFFLLKNWVSRPYSQPQVASEKTEAQAG